MDLEANAVTTALNQLRASVEQSPSAAFDTLRALREVTPTLTKVRAEHVHVQHQRGKSAFTLFAGDLEVSGNFGYEHTVLVLGDLIVDGLIEDRFEDSPLLVAGNVRAQGLYIGSETHIGGSLELSELLHLRYTRGGKTLFVERGGRTKLFLWTPQDSKYIGTLDAMHSLTAYPDRDDPVLVTLRRLVSPYLARKLDVDEPDLTLLARALREGRPLWRAR